MIKMRFHELASASRNRGKRALGAYIYLVFLNLRRKREDPNLCLRDLNEYEANIILEKACYLRDYFCNKISHNKLYKSMIESTLRFYKTNMRVCDLFSDISDLKEA